MVSSSSDSARLSPENSNPEARFAAKTQADRQTGSADEESSFTNFCLVTACRLTVVYPAIVVVSLPLCRFWALLIIACWLFSGHWEERLALVRKNILLMLSVLLLLHAAVGIQHSADVLRSLYEGLPLGVVPVVATLLFHRPERRAPMFAVFNLSVVVALAVYFFPYWPSGGVWPEFLGRRTFFLFENDNTTGMVLLLWAGLWICCPFTLREIPWIRSRLSAAVRESLSAASRLHPGRVAVDVFRRQLPWQAIFFSTVRWGVVGGVACFLFCVNPFLPMQIALSLSLGVLLCVWNIRQGFVFLVFFVVVLFQPERLANLPNESFAVASASGWIGLSLPLILLGTVFVLSFAKPSPWKSLGLFLATALIVDGVFNGSASLNSDLCFYGIFLAALFVADVKLRSPQPERPERFDVAGPERLLRKLEFVREVDKLKQILRRNSILGGVRLENDAEHSWHVAVMAVLFAEEKTPSGVDLLRVLKMLLVHDLVEIDAGDTYAFDTVGHKDKEKREKAAADRIFSILPENEGRALRELWEEFDAGETADGKFALALDRLQPMLQNYLNAGAVWQRNGISPERVRARLDSLRESVPELGRIADAIIDDAVARGFFSPTGSFAVIVAAAGKSSRFGSSGGSVKKPFLNLAGRPVWLHSVERFAARPDVRQLIVVVSPDDETWFREQYAEEIQRLRIDVVRGGSERFESVQLALNAVRESIDYVAVHDAARPCVSPEGIDAVFQATKKHGAAMLAAPLVGTVKRIDDDRIVETVPRELLWEAQTPQVFERQLLLEAYAEKYGRPTDDAQLVERLGKAVLIVPGDRRNIKITTPEDFDILQRMLTETNKEPIEPGPLVPENEIPV